MTTLEEVDVLDCRRYARHLKRRARDGEFKAGTATTYYAYVRTFLSFCVVDDFLDTNPAKAKRATDELPEDLGDADRQFWREDERRAILCFVDNRANRALDGEADVNRERAFRIVLSSISSASPAAVQMFAAPADDKRTGVTWSDVQLDNGAVRVLGKSREYEYAHARPHPRPVCRRRGPLEALLPLTDVMGTYVTHGEGVGAIHDGQELYRLITLLEMPLTHRIVDECSAR